MNREIFFDPVDHTYTDAYGQGYTPVTQICKYTPRATDFDSIPNRKIVEIARERGTMIHAEIEAFIKRGEEGISLTFQWFKRVLYPMFSHWESEVVIYSNDEALPYAGTIDLIAYDEKKKRWIIIDLKTGGHETVDYQESLYKRGFCKIRNIDPENVDLFCIDAHDEGNIGFFQVRTITKAWLDDLLQCVADDIPYEEPLPSLKGFSEVQINELMKIENYIASVEADIKELTKKRNAYRDELLYAMGNALVDTFEFGSIKVTRVKESSKEVFDEKRFKAEKPELYEQYKTTQRNKAYLKVTVRDATAKEK